MSGRASENAVAGPKSVRKGGTGPWGVSTESSEACVMAQADPIAPAEGLSPRADLRGVIGLDSGTRRLLPETGRLNPPRGDAIRGPGQSWPAACGLARQNGSRTTSGAEWLAGKRGAAGSTVCRRALNRVETRGTPKVFSRRLRSGRDGCPGDKRVAQLLDPGCRLACALLGAPQRAPEGEVDSGRDDGSHGEAN
jgi:hypothetical protein